MMIRTSKHILLLLNFLAVIPALVHCSSSKLGFFSIDCGSPTEYFDDTTGIFYTLDEPYVRTGVGVNREVLAAYQGNNVIEKQLINLRSFPDGARNCYTLVPQQVTGTKYLIRVRFMYGNYDSENVLPEFHLYLGVDLWDTIKFPDAGSVVTKELIHNPTSNVTYICLVNTGLGTPFISAIELRPMKTDFYVTQSGSLSLLWRLDFGNENRTIRYPDDVRDRIWQPYVWGSTVDVISTSISFDQGVGDNWFQTPDIVMRTAVMPRNASEPIRFYWKPSDPSDKYYAYWNFGEVQKLKTNQTRSFDLKLNGKLKLSEIPNYLFSDVIYDVKGVSEDWFNYTIERTANSTLPPLINALEMYIAKDFLLSETDQADVSAMKNIQAAYGIGKDWVADPCAPQNYSWDGLGCSFKDNDPPRVIYLNLSSSGLSGEISQYLSDLNLLQNLDLSNNNLTGKVPDFFSQMMSLTVLNLNGNNLTGTVPIDLAERSQEGSLILRYQSAQNDGNPNLCLSGTCSAATTHSAKRKSVLLPIASVAVVTLFILGVAIYLIWRHKKLQGKNNRHDRVGFNSVDHKGKPYIGSRKRFPFSEILRMTNNFERILGNGGFGTVFYGYLDNGVEVAVKLLNPSSDKEGYKQFHTEAEILMTVRHANLTSMVGYCKEGTHLAVVYEYMAKGNLEDNLSPVKSLRLLSWEERLIIALDAAQGLEYLHHGCLKPVIHRDVKSTNILLTDRLQAKFADFGISKTLPDDGCSHVSTEVMGTSGYLDPEYFNSRQLNERSDVFGFGVVLLELLTGHKAIMFRDNNPPEHVINWVSTLIETKGDIRSAVDQRLLANFDTSSAWKLVEIAMACVKVTSLERPKMNKVVVELQQCLAKERARKNRGCHLPLR